MGLQPAPVPLPPAQGRDEAWFLELKSVVDRLNAALLQGTGSPAGVVVANIGTLYRALDGTASTTLWIKEADSGAATGWRAV